MVARLCWRCGKGDGKSTIRMPQSSLFSPRFSLFFLNKSCSDCCKPLFNFQSSGKDYFDDFCQRSYCFYGGTPFGSPHSAISEMLLSVLQMRKRTETERVIDSLRGCWLLMACILVVIQRTWVGLRPEQILYLYQSV